MGHIISEEGIRVDPNKVAAVQKWPVPQGVAQLRSFLGLANYFRKFIKGYSSIVAPLTSLTGSKVPWEWNTVHQSAFEEVKTALVNAPVLALPDPSKPYTIISDASLHGTGGILMQEGRVIAYISHKFDAAQRNYITTDQECLGVIHALQEWRCYVEGTDVTLITDHQPLTHLQKQAAKGPLSRRQARWMEILSRFHFKFQYRKGSENAADPLSRVPHLLALRASLVIVDIRAQIKEGYATDPAFSDPARTKSWHKDADTGLWLTEHGKVVVPASKVTSVMKELHDSAEAAHQGVQRTLWAIRRRFWWPHMNQDIERYVLSCPKCQANKASTQKPAGLLQSLKVPTRSWQCITMDFITGLPMTARGFDAILVIVDRFSKMVHFVPTRTDQSAADIWQLFTDHVIRLHGAVEEVVGDRDSKWNSHFWRAMMENLGTKLKLSTAYHPQTDGQTERMNRVLEEALRSAIGADQEDWDRHLSMIEFALNMSINTSTKNSPFMLTQLDPPLFNLDLQIPSGQVPAADRTAAAMVERLHAARDCLQRAKERHTMYANQKRRELEFEEGDSVMLNTQNLRKAMPGKSKLQPRFVGPFKVVKRIGEVAYKLQLPAGYRIHPVFHVSLLKAYREGKDRPLPPEPTQPIATNGRGPLFTLGGEDWFEVQDIVGHQEAHVKYKRGRKSFTRKQREYLVRWAGYGPDEDKWRPARDLCRDSEVEQLIKNYCERNNVQFKRA